MDVSGVGVGMLEGWFGDKGEGPRGGGGNRGGLSARGGGVGKWV